LDVTTLFEETGKAAEEAMIQVENNYFVFLSKISDDSHFIVTEDQNRATHPTSVAVYARGLDLVGSGG